MKRAAILIGVERSGGLPTLKDAINGAHQMQEWAISQGIDTVLITDENQPVELGHIKKAVRKIVKAGNVDQLLIYFAGHGVNIRYGEYWLLSDAPSDTQAAVNLSGSVVLARYAGIPHVIFVSDACRTAADGIQAQFVTGGEIFPNNGADDLEKPVDQFFACTLGRPAHEVKDPITTSNEYFALYTNELVNALNGDYSKLVEWTPQGNGLIRPRPLKRYIIKAVSNRILDLRLQTKLIQVPDARITSDNKAWLAKLKRTPVARREIPAAVAPAAAGAEILVRNPDTGQTERIPSNYRFAKRWTKEMLVSEGLLDKVYKNSEMDEGTRERTKEALYKLRDLEKIQASGFPEKNYRGNSVLYPREPKESLTGVARYLQKDLPSLPRLTGVARYLKKVQPFQPRKVISETTANLAKNLLRSALYDSPSEWHDDLAKASLSRSSSGPEFVKSVAESIQPFGPMHHETECGFKIRGKQIVGAYARHAKTELLTFEQPGEAVRIDSLKKPGASVVLEFKGGAGVVLPAIPGFLGALTMEEDELVDVSYEPSENTWMWDIYKDQAEKIRTLRGIASASTRNGVFRLEGDDAMEVARRMQYAKGIDPTLGIYAAYAYHEMQRRDLIEEMSDFMRDGIGAPLFDIALLSHMLDNRSLKPGTNAFGFMPLLAQGWALLPSFRVRLPNCLSEIQKTLLPSVWSLFNAEGVDKIIQAIEKGEVI